MVKEFLVSDRKIYDPVHGFIRYDTFEKLLIDSLPFQRLHYIRQLGSAYLVYPGATHTRFEHSLGVMELASRIYEGICKNVRPDVFHFVPRKGSVDYQYWLQILRLAALSHDLGHLPFSHVAEKDLLGKLGHELWTLKILESPHLDPVWEALERQPIFQESFTHRSVKQDVIKLAIGEGKLKELTPKIDRKFTCWERILSQVISGDFFGADRIDYLLRDSRSTGIVYGLFDYLQLIEMLRILPSIEKAGDLELGIDENGIESCEALLLARHFMHKRVYQYSSVKAYNFHLRRFMRLHYQKSSLFTSVDHFLFENDSSIIFALQSAALDPSHKGYEDARKIILRKNHFKAVSLPDFVKISDLETFQKENAIPKNQIEWQIDQEEKKSIDLSFPVSKRYLVLEKAKDSSHLLSNIPPTTRNWVYISPEFELILLDWLKK